MGMALGLLRVVPVWAWILAVLLAWGAFQKHRATVATRQSERSAAAAVIATAAAEQQRVARNQEFEFAQAARKAADVYAKNVARKAGDAAAARTELDRLRDTLAATAASAACPAPSAAGLPDAAGTIRELFGECAATLQDLAAEADRLEGKLTGLQDHVRSTQRSD